MATMGASGGSGDDDTDELRQSWLAARMSCSLFGEVKHRLGPEEGLYLLVLPRFRD